MDGKNGNGNLRVREVCELVGISPHTLRYWEKEFPDYLQPARTGGGHRLYDDHNLRKLLQLKHLLKDKFYSLKGARKLIRQQEKGDTAHV